MYRLNNDKYEVKMIHTNCQSAMNKRSEILDLVNSEKPLILALTEFGAASTTLDSELGIQDYTIYRGDHSDGTGGLGKGAAMYVHNSLNHSACPTLENNDFDCAAWCVVKLKNDKIMLVGTVYRSPNSQEQNNENMLSMIAKATAMKHDFLVLCGDFNLPLIDWDANHCLDKEESFTAKFMEAMEDGSLVQHVQGSTRFRGEQNSCLDLVITNEEEMVHGVEEIPPLGKSDHVCQKWNVIITEPMFRNTAQQRPYFKRANWDGIKSDLNSLKLSTMSTADEMNENLTEVITKAKARHIPLCKPRDDKNGLPWMRGAKINKQRKEKWRHWKKFRQSGLPRDYDAYKTERNKLGDMIRTAKTNHEKKLIADMKDNPNLYHGHCRRFLKTKQGVSNVMDGNGKLTETETEAAEALNIYYHSVFTQDDGETTPRPLQLLTNEKIEDVYFSGENIEDVLIKLNPN